MNSVPRSHSAGNPESPYAGMSDEDLAARFASIVDEISDGETFDPKDLTPAMRAERTAALREIETRRRLGGPRASGQRPVFRTRARARSTRRTHQRAARPATVASADDGPSPAPSLLDQLVLARGALVAALAAVDTAMAATVRDPLVELRQGLPGVATARQLLDAHRGGGFVAAGRPLVARKSAILSWYESRLEPPPAPVAEPVTPPAERVDDGVRVVSKLRSIRGGASR